MRLSRLMSLRGLCSRREADRFIELGLVLVDGRPVSELGVQVNEDCDIVLAAGAHRKQRRLITILLNKPVGFISGQAERGHRSAVSLITERNRVPRDRSKIRFHAGHRRNLAPAGRLDIDSQGLLVLTQDGRIARRLIAPDRGVEKEYLVRIQGSVDPRKLARLRHGMQLDGRRLKRAQVDQINPDQLRFVLAEGRKRQIRRMCEQVGLKVTGLKRVRIGQIVLGGLREGQWRYLGPRERF
jgi:23S rRNA pseudouridine2604 synthase